MILKRMMQGIQAIFLGLLLVACGGGDGDGDGSVSHATITDAQCPSNVRVVADITQSRGIIKDYPNSGVFALEKNEMVAVRVRVKQALLPLSYGKFTISSNDSDIRTVALSDVCGNISKNTHTANEVELQYRVSDDHSDSLDSGIQKLSDDKTYYINVKGTDSCDGACHFFVTHESP